jgi:hypothetical protein
MSFLTRVMKQTATYWALSSFDKYGDPSFAAPVVLDPDDQTGVRWEDRTEQFIDDKGDIAHSRAWVWSETTEFTVGSYLYLGSSSTVNPETAGGDQIRRVEKTPDVGNKRTLYKAIL